MNSTLAASSARMTLTQFLRQLHALGRHQPQPLISGLFNRRRTTVRICAQR
jgi:hypothetical protein